MDHRVESPSASGTNRGRPGRRTRLAGLVAWCAVLSACASVYASFPEEEEIPSCARLLREAAEVPGRILRVEAGEAGGRPLFLEVEERGSGDRGRVLVLVHGVLSDRRTWRFMVGPLGAVHDLILVDLPGCGGSDRPEPGDMGPRGYDPDALARAVLGALRARLSGRPGATRVTLVGHSLGSAVVLRMLGNGGFRGAFADVLDRVDGAVLLSPLDVSYAKRDPSFEAIATLSALEVALGQASGVLPEAVAESVFFGVLDPSTTPLEEVRRLCGILTDPERRRAAQSMLRSAVPFTEDLRPDWPRIEALEADYARVEVPVLVASGGRDDALPEALAFKIRQQLPDARLRVLPRSGHSLPTERPEECAGLALDFVATRGEGWAEYAELPPEGRAAVAVLGR